VPATQDEGRGLEHVDGSTRGQDRDEQGERIGVDDEEVDDAVDCERDEDWWDEDWWDEVHRLPWDGRKDHRLPWDGCDVRCAEELGCDGFDEEVLSREIVGQQEDS